MRKPAQIALVTASMLGGAVAGGLVLTPTLSGTQEADDPPTTETTTAPDDTAAPPTDPAPGEHDAGSWIADALAPLVDDGTITQDQADAVAGALEQARPHRGPGAGGHGPGGRGWFGPQLGTVAEALGLDVDALRDALADGRTIAEVAEAAGVDVQGVIDAVLAEADARLADAVADGRIDQDRADELRAGLEERLDDLVDRPLPLGGRGPWGGPDHDRPADATTDETAA